MSLVGGEGVKVRVRFVTSHDAYRVTDAPFVLPQKLGRYGLSEVVNHLLGSSEPQPFDFSIQGVLLRSQLKTFLQTHRVSLEEIVTIDYYPALSLSEEAEVLDTPAWVGSLTCAIAGTVIAGCYDGSVQIGEWSGVRDGGGLTSVFAHPQGQPIRAVAAWRGGGGGGGGQPLTAAGEAGLAYLATASKDLTVKLWTLGDAGGGSRGKGGKAAGKQAAASTSMSMHQVAELTGHINSVESVRLWGERSVLLSGDWAGNVFGWNLSQLGSWGQADDAQSKKKMKTGTNVVGGSKPTLREVKSAFIVRAHSQAVSCICVVDQQGQGSSRVLTSSWDHSIKEWDMNTQNCIATVVSNKVVTGMSVGGENGGTVLTSHPDGKTRLWDLRTSSAGGTGECRSIYASSTAQWVSDVAWHPSNDKVFAAADYAGIVRIWDTRSSTAPLGSTEAHDGKALCCAWDMDVEGNASILSGGSDCRISAHAFA